MTISDVPTARKVLAGMTALLEQAPDPFKTVNSWAVMAYIHGTDTSQQGPDTQLLNLAVNGWPSLIAHAEDVFDRHGEDPYARGECSYCQSDWAFATNWPCPDVLSVFALLTPYESLVDVRASNVSEDESPDSSAGEGGKSSP